MVSFGSFVSATQPSGGRGGGPLQICQPDAIVDSQSYSRGKHGMANPSHKESSISDAAGEGWVLAWRTESLLMEYPVMS